MADSAPSRAPDGNLRPGWLAGLLYWYGLYPVHNLVFGDMLRALAAAASADGRLNNTGSDSNVA